MTTNTPTTGPLSRRCRHCDSPPGIRCHSPNGRPAPPHAVRRDPTATGLPGRNTILNLDTIAAICHGLRLGATIQMSALAAGVGTTTLRNWMAQGEADEETGDDTPYMRFRVAVTQARAEGAISRLEKLYDAAERHLVREEPVLEEGKVVRDSDGNPLLRRVWEADWRAAAWVLERSFARDFGRREIVELSQGDGVVPQVGAAAAAGMAGAGDVSRIVENLQAFKARKALEVAQLGPAEQGAEVTDAEVVEDAPG